jgi:hypothetical protein
MVLPGLRPYALDGPVALRPGLWLPTLILSVVSVNGRGILSRSLADVTDARSLAWRTLTIPASTGAIAQVAICAALAAITWPLRKVVHPFRVRHLGLLRCVGHHPCLPCPPL